MAKTTKAGYTETIDGIELQADPSLEGLDDIDGPIDDAWAEAVARLSRMSTRASRRDTKKERRLPAATFDPDNPFARYYKQRHTAKRKEISRRKDEARLRAAMSNAMLDAVDTSMKHLSKPKPKPKPESEN